MLRVRVTEVVSHQAEPHHGDRNRKRSPNRGPCSIRELRLAFFRVACRTKTYISQAGVFLPQQFRVFHKGGQIFRDLAVRTQHGKPTCAVVFGSSTAGGAYHPALSDYTIFVEDQAQVFLGGPPLVKMATGEEVTAEELGGAKVHATVTGLADQLAVDE